MVLKADVDEPAQEGAGGKHDGLCAEADAGLRDDPGDAITLNDEVIDRLLEDLQVRLVLQARADRCTVERTVGLGAGGAHRRALAAVERAPLDAGGVGGECHRPAQRVNLLDQVPLADTADRGVAAHLAERLDAVRDQQRAATHARSGERGLGAGMAATHHDDLEQCVEKHGNSAG